MDVVEPGSRVVDVVDVVVGTGPAVVVVAPGSPVVEVPGWLVVEVVLVPGTMVVVVSGRDVVEVVVSG